MGKETIIYNDLEQYNQRKLSIEKNFLVNFNEKIDDFFSSSGRIELLGNHTDHNNGLVLVSAVSLDIFSGVKKTSDNYIRIISEGYPLMTINIKNPLTTPFTIALDLPISLGDKFKFLILIVINGYPSEIILI